MIQCNKPETDNEPWFSLNEIVGVRHGDTDKYYRIEEVYRYYNHITSLAGYFVDKKPSIIIKGEDIVSIEIYDLDFKPDDVSMYYVSFKLDSKLDQIIRDFTSRQLKKHIALFFGGKVFSVYLLKKKLVLILK